MPTSESGKVIITIQDIYHQQNELRESVNSLSSKFDRMTERLEKAIEVEEISRNALKKAEKAVEKAEEALEKVEKREEYRNEMKKVWMKSLITALIPWVLTLLGGLIILTNGGGLNG